MSDNDDRRHRKSRKVLNRLLALEQYSLANFLLYAPPWTTPDEEPLVETVRRIAADQQENATRIGQLLFDRYGYAESGQFPFEFTAYDDLALDYLLQPLLDHQRRLVEEVARCVEQLADDPEAKQLAEEVLASEKRHLEQLKRLPVPAQRGR